MRLPVLAVVSQSFSLRSLEFFLFLSLFALLFLYKPSCEDSGSWFRVRWLTLPSVGTVLTTWSTVSFSKLNVFHGVRVVRYRYNIVTIVHYLSLVSILCTRSVKGTGSRTKTFAMMMTMMMMMMMYESRTVHGTVSVARIYQTICWFVQLLIPILQWKYPRFVFWVEIQPHYHWLSTMWTGDERGDP